MIKTCYRGMIKDDEPGYFVLFLLIWFSFSAFVGFGAFWGFYFFSPIFGDTLFYLGWMSGVGTWFAMLARWLQFVSQRQRGVFDKPKVKKEKSKDDSRNETLSWIKEMK